MRSLHQITTGIRHPEMDGLTEAVRLSEIRRLLQGQLLEVWVEKGQVIGIWEHPETLKRYLINCPEKTDYLKAYGWKKTQGKLPRPWYVNDRHVYPFIERQPEEEQ